MRLAANRVAVVPALLAGLSCIAAAPAPAALPAPAPASPGQQRGNGVATLVLRDAVLTGISLGASRDPDSGPDGGPVRTVRLRVSALEARGLDLARPRPDGALRITARGAVRSRRELVVHATWACVRGLGVTRAGILDGLLDGPVNDALDVDPERGFRPTWATTLANLVGATGVPVVADELRIEVAGLRTDDLTLPGLRLVQEDRAPGPLRGCRDRSAFGAPATRTVTPDAAVERLRTVPRLEDLPDLVRPIRAGDARGAPATGAQVGRTTERATGRVNDGPPGSAPATPSPTPSLTRSPASPPSPEQPPASPSGSSPAPP